MTSDLHKSSSFINQAVILLVLYCNSGLDNPVTIKYYLGSANHKGLKIIIISNTVMTRKLWISSPMNM